MTLFISKLMNGIMELLIVSVIPFINTVFAHKKGFPPLDAFVTSGTKSQVTFRGTTHLPVQPDRQLHCADNGALRSFLLLFQKDRSQVKVHTLVCLRRFQPVTDALCRTACFQDATGPVPCVFMQFILDVF